MLEQLRLFVLIGKISNLIFGAGSVERKTERLAAL